jgi:hypothetical protein
MTPMFTLFPYGSFVMMHFSSDSFGFPLALLQFPVYTVVLIVAKGARWRVGILLLVIALHVAAASFFLADYCQSARTCSLRHDPINPCTGAARASTASMKAEG